MPSHQGQQAIGLLTTPLKSPLQCPASGFCGFTVWFRLAGQAQRSCFLFFVKTELPKMITRGWNSISDQRPVKYLVWHRTYFH